MAGEQRQCDEADEQDAEALGDCQVERPVHQDELVLVLRRCVQVVDDQIGRTVHDAAQDDADGEPPHVVAHDLV